MSQENVEIVQAAYDALNREDWEALFRDTHRDIEFTFQRAPNPGPHRGREAILRRIQEQFEPFDRWALQPDEYFEAGEYVVVLITSRAEPHGTGAEIEVRVGHVWTIRDGKIVSVRLFQKRAEALEAAGLSE